MNVTYIRRTIFAILLLAFASSSFAEKFYCTVFAKIDGEEQEFNLKVDSDDAEKLSDHVTFNDYSVVLSYTPPPQGVTPAVPGLVVTLNKNLGNNNHEEILRTWWIDGYLKYILPGSENHIGLWFEANKEFK